MDNVIARCAKLQRGRHKHHSLLSSGKTDVETFHTKLQNTD